MLKITLFRILLLWLLVSTTTVEKAVAQNNAQNNAPNNAPNNASISHSTWNDLLRKHVSKNGQVNYKAFRQDISNLNAYLELLNRQHPNETWSKQEQMAFWINAYNAFTVKLILNNYPIKSINDIKNGVPNGKKVWDSKFIKIGDKTYSLNQLEHTMLLDEFEDPRVHFALNCAAASCPKLRNEAFTAEKLTTQLDAAARDFLQDASKNKITASGAQLSKLFEWYRGDFTKKLAFHDFINQYAKQKIDAKTTITYLEYSWMLNE
jgi:Protein of unknown function, DUF547